MAGRKFLWVGGITGTVSAQRFNFNVANNWLLTNGDPTNPTSKWSKSTVVPGPYDLVYIGCSRINKPTSPLLFGGFSAEATGGNWFGTHYQSLSTSGYVNGITLDDNSGNIYSGNTFTSHLNSFNVVGEQTQNIFTYPFPVIGGGLTGDAIDLLKGCTVEGMNPAAWDALASACTAKQSKLVIKADNVVLQGDNARNYDNGGIPWNSYTQNTDWYFGPPTQQRYIYLELADNISSSTSSVPNTIKTNLVLNGTALKVFLTNSKIIQTRVGITQKLVHEPFYIPELSLKNCVVLGIDNDNLPFKLQTSHDCVVGTINFYVNEWWKDGFANAFGVQTPEVVGLSWNPYTALHELSGTFSTKRAYQLLTTGSTLGSEYRNFNYDVSSGVTTGMIFQFGSRWFDQDSSKTLGSTFSAYEGAFYGFPHYDERTRSINPMSNSTLVSFLAGGKFEKLIASGIRLLGNGLVPTDIIGIMNFEMQNNAYFDSTSYYGFKNWRFGFISGTTYSGGIVFNDTSDNIIKGDPGIRFLNYGVYGKSVNIRSNNIIDISSSGTPPAESQ